MSLDRSYIGCIERGGHNFNVMTLIKIAKSLEVEIGDLFSQLCLLKVYANFFFISLTVSPFCINNTAADVAI